MKVADQVWVATALLHRTNPDRNWFWKREIEQRAVDEGFVPLRPGFATHVSRHAVAGLEPKPGNYRMLTEVGRGQRRLFRTGDPVHAGRTGKQFPERDDLPEQYRHLVDWYLAGYDPAAGAPVVREARATFTVEEEPPASFERAAARALEQQFDVRLAPRSVAEVPKRFDFVADDGSLVGDAKYFTLVNGTGLPPAKFSIIAEHVWLLEKVPARERVLVFGNDRRVPMQWLRRYGHLAGDVRFFFLGPDGTLEELSRHAAEDSSWAKVSARSFKRDWDSPEDSVYDDITSG